MVPVGRVLIGRGFIGGKGTNLPFMATPDVKTLFGIRVRQLRKLRGWSQEDFAHRAGLDRSYMGGVERGERNISLENICVIAKALDVPTANLFMEWMLAENSELSNE